MKQKFATHIFILLALVALSSCSKFNKLMKSDNTEKKYEAAMDYYHDKDYSKALSLFDELATVYRGSNKSEDIHYYVANCHYALKEYYLAGYYYKNFTKTYPTSPRVEECAFKSAYCSYLNSPKPSLDQADTRQAIEDFQLFLNRYPSTSLKDSANSMIDELRMKLEQKEFEIAKLYYLTENYKSASVALENVAKEFPNSPHMEEIKFLIIKSNYRLAINSVFAKKEERLTQTIESYHSFVDNYEASKYVKEAESYYADALEELNKLKTIN